MRHGKVDVGLANTHETASEVIAGLGGILDKAVHRLKAGQCHGIDQGLLVAEVLGRGAVTDINIAGQLPQGESVHASFFNDFHGAFQEGFPEFAVVVGLVSHAISLGQCSH
ncbi:hypothetical protein D3C73_1387140 [compost metagenome]